MKIKQNYTLRRPAGPHPVGYATRLYVYEGKDGSRRLPCQCYYPASEKQEEAKAYFSDLVYPGTGSILTNSYPNAPVLPGAHPVLVFSHGYGFACEYNTIQFEHLASHGYVVLSIGHEQDGVYVLEDGTILPPQPPQLAPDAYTKTLNAFNAYREFLGSHRDTASFAEHYRQYQLLVEGQTEILHKTGDWAEHNLYVLDRILEENGQPDSAFYGRLDGEKVGAFGMSLGGAAAITMTYRSNRIRACANLDGFFPYAQQAIPAPVLLFQNCTPMTDGSLWFPYLHTVRDAYHLAVRDCTHNNFTDMTAVLQENFSQFIEANGEQVEVPTLGSVDPEAMESLMNDALLDFFDKYLEGRESTWLDKDKTPDFVTLSRKK